MTDHTDRSTEALLARKTLAEEATPGPWKNHMAIRRGYGVTAVLSGDGATIADMENSEFPTEEADAAHIAANDPQTIMADIDEILRLRAENKRLQCAFNDAAEKMQFIERRVKSIYENCLMFTPKQAIGESLSVLVDMMTCKAVEKQTCPKN